MDGIPAVEVAQRLGLSRDQLMRLVFIGELKAQRIQRRWYIDPESVRLMARKLGRERAAQPVAR